MSFGNQYNMADYQIHYVIQIWHWQKSLTYLLTYTLIYIQMHVFYYAIGANVEVLNVKSRLHFSSIISDEIMSYHMSLDCSNFSLTMKLIIWLQVTDNCTQQCSQVNYRSRHCLPVRPCKCLDIALQCFGPYCITKLPTISSSWQCNTAEWITCNIWFLDYFH